MVLRICSRLRFKPIIANARRNNSGGGGGGRETQSLATPPFLKLVETLKSNKQTCTILESSTGGLLTSSLMSVPGSSKVFFGSTVAYNTKRSGPLLCGGEELHRQLLNASKEEIRDGIDIRSDLSEETRDYVRTKINWTRAAALSYCERMNTDFAIAEGGATGPTFHPKGMTSGFSVLALAGRPRKEGNVELLAQKVVYSAHADRELNMRLFADAAAELCLEAATVRNAFASSEAPTSKPTSISDVVDTSEDAILDRSSHLRGNAPVMQDYHQRSDAKHVILRGTDEVFFASSNKLALPTLQSLNEDAALASLLDSAGTGGQELLAQRTFLGRLGASRTPLFALFLPEGARMDGEGYRDCYFDKTRPRAPFLTPLHNELALTATAYAQWHRSHRFCPASGAPLEHVDGGTCARAVGDDGEVHLHWPRQDPSIITLVTNPASTHALLARSPRHSTYLYTALAGFVEPGETFESAVRREVREEVGVAVDGRGIEYVASQAWPFPRSCMIGMAARTSDGLPSISIDPDEIVDAQWFEKEVVYQAARDTDMIGAVMDPRVVAEKQAAGEWNGNLLVPSKGVLARTLIDHWLENN